jgi:cobalt-zinc-cadmium efflux system membrane fusion protein
VVKVTGSAAALIKAEPVTPGQDRQIVTVTGELTLDDNRVLCLTPRFAGRLASISLRVGDPVQAGQPLFVLESHELAEAALALLKRRAELDLAAKRYEREKMLFERQIGSAQEAQEAQAALDLAQLETENARRRLALFGLPADQVAALEKGAPTRLTTGEFLVRSPLAGRVLERAGNVGDRVTGDKEVMKVADLTHLTALVQVHEQDLGAVLTALKDGPLPAEVTADAFPGRVFEAMALQADLQISRETRTLPVRLEVENPDELLRPGLFIRGRLRLGERQAPVSLPLAALQEDAGQAFVFVRLTDDLYVRRDVQPGPRLGDLVAIEEGLQPGEVVAVDGAFLLKSDVLREKMGAGCAD